VARSGGKLSFRDVLRGAVATCRAHSRLLLAAAVVVFVPVGLLEALDNRIQEVDWDAFTDLEVLALIGIVAVHSSSALLGEVFYTGVVAAAVTQVRTGASHPFAEFVRTLPYGRLIAVDVLFSSIVAAGLLALVVPGLVFFTWFALAAAAVKLENRGVLSAFRRSRELVRGSFWRVFAVLVPLTLVTNALTDAAGALATAVLGDTLVADWVGSALAGVSLTPLYAVAVVVVAYELIELKGSRERAGARVPVGAGGQEPE
jgi:hypothetical protein